MGTGSAGEFDPQIAALIKHKAKRLIGRYGFRRDDREDLEQELAMHVVAGMQKYEPSRASARTYADRIISSKIASIIERATAQKRDRRRERPLQDDVVLLARSTPATDLVADVRCAVAALPPDLRALVTLFENHSQAEVARRTGLSRQRVRTARTYIARHFARHGLGPERPLRIRSTNRRATPVHDHRGGYVAAA